MGVENTTREAVEPQTMNDEDDNDDDESRKLLALRDSLASRPVAVGRSFTIRDFDIKRMCSIGLYIMGRGGVGWICSCVLK